MTIRLVQYSYISHVANAYRATTPGINAPTTAYNGPLLDAAIAALTPLIPAGQLPQSLEIDPAGDVPTAFTESQQTYTDPVTGTTSTVTVQTPSAFRQGLAITITTDITNITLGSEAVAAPIRDALLALWADVAATLP